MLKVGKFGFYGKNIYRVAGGHFRDSHLVELNDIYLKHLGHFKIGGHLLAEKLQNMLKISRPLSKKVVNFGNRLANDDQKLFNSRH